MVKARCQFGTGGIATKLDAAEKAAAAGIPTVISSGVQAGALSQVFDATTEVGTLIVPDENRSTIRKALDRLQPKAGRRDR